MDSRPENMRAAPSTAAAEEQRLEVSAFALALLRAGELEIYRRVNLEVDRVLLETVLKHVKGNQVQASKLLGISRTTLRGKLRALGMSFDKQTPCDGADALA